MICRIGDVVRRGRVVAIDRDIDPTAVAAAVRRERGGPAWLTVTAATPQPVYEHVGCLRPGMGLRTRTALARAARTRDLSTPLDDELEQVRTELADLTVDGESLAHHRERLAQTEAETERLEERAATIRGRLQARRDADLDTGDTAERLEATIRQLSEAETSAVAARQELRRARSAARERRDRRDRKLTLEDRVANLERRARAHLIEKVRDEFVAALSRVPETGSSIDEREPFRTDPLPAALAVARVADLSAPVVLACDLFDSPWSASDWLDAPVLDV